MMENYRLPERLAEAVGYAPERDSGDLRELGRSIMQSMTQLKQYFGDGSFVGEMPEEKRGQILRGLADVSDNIDEFMSYMPQKTVDAAKAQLIAENQLNMEEYNEGFPDDPLVNIQS